MRIHPFRAWRPSPELAPDVASVPYDTIDTDEARALVDGNPKSFLRVTRPEVELGAAPEPEALYEQGRKKLVEFQAEGWLEQEAEPCLYVYALTMDGNTQHGLVGCCHVDDYRNNVIRKHEKTRPDKEDDRTRMIVTQGAHTGPVFLTYNGQSAVDAEVARVEEDAPLIDLTADDGVRHQVWRVADTAALTRAFDAVPLAYVADGHHRAAAASRASETVNPGGGESDVDWFLTVLFPAEQLDILAYNRCVSDLNGHTPEAFLDALSGVCDVEDSGEAVPAGPREVCMYLAGAWRTLRFPEGGDEDAVSSLDVSLLQDGVLAPLLGVADPRRDARISFVGGIRGTSELERRVDSGKALVAFSMHPADVQQMIRIADEDRIMPPKSTWFEPKLRSGLFVHRFTS